MLIFVAAEEGERWAGGEDGREAENRRELHGV